jgi:hypothetical protein
MAVSRTELTQIYLAYFGRPPDIDGLTYYTSNAAFTMASVAAGFSASPESQALYGVAFSADVIDRIYQNLFNRHAEPAGLAYWSGEVTAGRITAAGAALAILQGAQNDDLVTVQNKLAIATAFTEALDTAAEISGYSGAIAAASARAFLHGVDSTAGGLLGATASVDAAVSASLSAATVSTMNTQTGAVALANATTIDLTGFSGITNFIAGAGVAAGATATVTGFGANSSVEIAGAFAAGVLKTVMALNTTADTLNVKLNPGFTDDNDTVAELQAMLVTGLDASGIETLNVTSTAAADPMILSVVPGYKADYAGTWLYLDDTSLNTLLVAGDQPLKLWAVKLGGAPSQMTSLATVNASALVAAGTFAGDLGGQVGFQFFVGDPSGTKASTIVGSISGANELWGSDAANVIVGGAKNDYLYGGKGGDTMTGGAGNDVFVYAAGHATISALDSITDFKANTVGQGTDGAATSAGATADIASRNGDVIDLTSFGGASMAVAVWSNATDATLYLQSIASGGAFDMAAALDASTGRLYVDTDSNGSADTVVTVPGVTALTAAAFLI